MQWYGDIANINRCISNFAVKVYERIVREGIKVQGEGFEEIESSYSYEIENGFSHYVSGKIVCRLGDAEEVLRVAFAGVK